MEWWRECHGQTSQHNNADSGASGADDSCFEISTVYIIGDIWLNIININIA